ncbi:MAG: response regulator [Magnetococcales bacterium]|nr:response regulator [Magnetococcales bacterium]
MSDAVKKTIRVLLVENSPVALALTRRGLAKHPEIEVVGEARDGETALALIPERDPQVICTDMHMPMMDGLAFTHQVMTRFPRPILVVSLSGSDAERRNLFPLFEAGALDFLPKTMAWGSQGGDAFSRDLAAKIKSLAGLTPIIPKPPTATEYPVLDRHDGIKGVVVGAGLGGVQAFKDLLAGLPSDFPVPILCVQHLDPDFQEDFVDWVGQHTDLPVQKATHGEVAMAGSVYFPPRGQHLSLDAKGHLTTSQAPPVEGCRPSITVTMESMANRLGARVVGVLLSGSGRDGLLGMEAIYRAGGVTLAQDQSSALLFDLPGKAKEQGSVTHMLPGAALPRGLLDLVVGRQERRGEARSETPSEVPKRGISVLIVEDSPTQAFKLKRFLVRSGFDVTVAKDGVEGLEKALEVRPQIIVSDVSMPRMDGFELCRRVKSHPEIGAIPVILVTALTNPGEILEGLGAGADNYLTKPWEEAHLLSSVDILTSPHAGVDDRRKAMDIEFEGRKFTINSSRWQILNLLLSTYQKAVQQNKQLTDSQLELKMLNLQLVDQSVKQESLNKQLADEIEERKKVEARRLVTMAELKEANRELDDFAYIVSHDLKAPFRAIGSLTNWLVNDYAEQLDMDGRDLLQLLAGRADRINRLIDSLLEYTKVNRVEDEVKAIDLNRLVKSVVKGLSLPEELEVRLDSPLPTIHFDERRARQIFFNLIDNGVRFMDKPLGEIRVTGRAEGAGWQFEVADNGPGIDEKYFEKIFKIFQTLQARDELETPGVGLALVRKIVEKYGGRIWITSQLGEGSQFHFTLPKLSDTQKQQGGEGVKRS